MKLVSFFTESGAPENWGIRYFLRSKRGDQKIQFKIKKGITYILLSISGSRERDCQMQLGDKNSNGTFKVNVKTFGYILVLIFYIEMLKVRGPLLYIKYNFCAVHHHFLMDTKT